MRFLPEYPSLDSFDSSVSDVDILVRDEPDDDDDDEEEDKKRGDDDEDEDDDEDNTDDGYSE
jgi:hypothetical protein